MINLIASNKRQQALQDVALDASLTTIKDQSESSRVLSQNNQFLTVLKIQTQKSDNGYTQFADTARRAWS